jgi:negative regulator of genetic competence, sporulation and motility
MFVTKIGVLHSAETETQADSKCAPIISENIMLGGEEKVKHQNKKLYTAFKFSSLDAMISACRVLEHIGYRDESSAYITDSDSLYLILGGIDTSGYEPIDKYSFISEYADSENHEAAKRYLGEHGKTICKNNAVQKLSKC